VKFACSFLSPLVLLSDLEETAAAVNQSSVPFVQPVNAGVPQITIYSRDKNMKEPSAMMDASNSHIFSSPGKEANRRTMFEKARKPSATSLNNFHSAEPPHVQGNIGLKGNLASDAVCRMDSPPSVCALLSSRDVPSPQGDTTPRKERTQRLSVDDHLDEPTDRRIGLLSKMKRLSSRRLLVEPKEDSLVTPCAFSPPQPLSPTNAQSLKLISPKQSPKDRAAKQTSPRIISPRQRPKQMSFRQKISKPASPKLATTEPRHVSDSPDTSENRRSMITTVKRLSSRRLGFRKDDAVISATDANKEPLDRLSPVEIDRRSMLSRSASTPALISAKSCLKNDVDSQCDHSVKGDLGRLNPSIGSAKKNLLHGIEPDDGIDFSLTRNDRKMKISHVVDAGSSVNVDRRSMMGRSASTPALLVRKSSLKKDNTSRRDGLQRAGSVKFDKVHMREYERTLGDNPAVSAGPPVSLGWHYAPEQELDVEQYESYRPPRRSKQEFAMPAKIREEMLVSEWGCTLPELRIASFDSDRIKGQRLETASQNKQVQYMEEMMENSRERLVPVPLTTDRSKMWEQVPDKR